MALFPLFIALGRLPRGNSLTTPVACRAGPLRAAEKRRRMFRPAVLKRPRKRPGGPTTTGRGMDASVTTQAKGADARAETLVASYERAGYAKVAPAILQPAEPFLD